MLSLFKGAPQAVYRSVGFQHGAGFTISDVVFDQLGQKGLDNQHRYALRLKRGIHRHDKHFQCVVLALQGAKHAEDAKGQ